MRLLPVLFIFTFVDAKRRRPEDHQDDVRRTKTNDVDMYPRPFQHGQDFGHVYSNGRRQMTEIEPDMVEPKTVEHARQLLRKVGNGLLKMKKPEDPLGFANPRDAMLYNNKINNPINIDPMEKGRRPQRVKNVTQNIRKEVEEEIQKKYSGIAKTRGQSFGDISFGKVPNENDGDKMNFFSKTSFELTSNNEDYIGNWTMCKEFAKRAVFHPDDVINIKWVPFYIWSPIRYLTSVIHTLTYPTKKLVKRYREVFGPYLDIEVDWEQPKLLLKESKDILLIAGDRKGLFYGIPNIELPHPIKDVNIKLTVIMVRLKIVDPYLAMTYCNEKYATIMSVDGTGPETDEEKAGEATILGFEGPGNPTSRDLELEVHKSNYEAEKKRMEDEKKYINIERPDDTLDPSLW